MRWWDWLPVRERLLRLEEVVSRLEELQREGIDPRGDFRQAWLAERGLQLAAEIALDVGNHILSAHFGVSAKDYEDILAQLASNNVLPTELHARLKGMGGFRNVLVHDYLRLDPRVVGEHLERAPVDFSAFSMAVRSWLAQLASR